MTVCGDYDPIFPDDPNYLPCCETCSNHRIHEKLGIFCEKSGELI